MHLFSLVKSSSLEIIFSKKLMLYVYLVLGILVVINQASTTLQFYNAYNHLHEFDVTIGEFYFISFGLFLPQWIVGGLMLRACIQRIRLNLWIKSAFTYVNYTPYFSPAEAGLLVDYEFSSEEFIATLLYLHYKGWIKLVSDGQTIQINILSHQINGTQYEKALLHSLKAVDGVTFTSFNSPELISIAKHAHTELINQMTSREYIVKERKVSNSSKTIIKVLYWVAGVVGVFNFISVVFYYETVSSINYPRYPVAPGQLYVLAFCALVVILIIISGFRPRLTQNVKDPHFAAWIEAAGFKLYLNKVFKDRLSSKYIDTQNPDTIRTLAPYAISFGILPTDLRTINHLLHLSP